MAEQTPQYAKSFDIKDVEGYVKYFNENGYVVIDNVITEEASRISKDEMWAYIKHKSQGKVDRNDSKTWLNDIWPRDICRNGGFMGRFPYMKRINVAKELIPEQPQAWKNRENPLVYEAFANVMANKKLWVSIDRYGVMRPTEIGQEIVGSKDETLQEDWATKKDWLHWDLSPFHYATSAAGFAPRDVPKDKLAESYGSRRVQGLITLTDCKSINGGFHCIPGFHGKRFEQWGKDNAKSYGSDKRVYNRNFVEVPDDDPMRKECTQVPMRERSLLIWDSQLPHGNFPNHSKQFRMVHYIKMIPADDPREFQPVFHYTKADPKEWFGDKYTPSPLGEKLFGLKEWTESS